MAHMNAMINFITTFLVILIAMAFFTLLERKVLGYSHQRKGPNKPSLAGMLTPIGDAMKLFLKEGGGSTHSNKKPFLLAPSISLFLALALWMIYPYPTSPLFLKHGLIIFITLSSLNVYALIFAGWSSNSKYALVGALRSTAQSLSYEVVMIMIILVPATLRGSFNLKSYAGGVSMTLMMGVVFTVWMITVLAETNRTPFDISEGESELVSGFNTEYSAGSFALIFMAEYTNILAMAMMTVILFLNFDFFPFMFVNQALSVGVTAYLSVGMIWTRATFPRVRYDQLMYMAWKVFLPFIIPLLFVFIMLSFMAN